MTFQNKLLFRICIVVLVAVSASLGLFNTHNTSKAATPGAPAPASPRCFPTCSPVDARFLSLAGSDLFTFAGGSTTIGLRVKGSLGTFVVGIFDGDVGAGGINAVWDQGLDSSTYSLFADQDNNGVPDGPAIDTLPFGSMTNNSWAYFTVTANPLARLGLVAGADYNYLLKVSLDPPFDGQVQNSFKVAVESNDTQIFISPQVLSLQAFQNNFEEVKIIHGNPPLPHCQPGDVPPGCAPSNYDGKWTFSFLVAPGTQAVNVWGGDFDIGLTASGSDIDTDDNTPNVTPQGLKLDANPLIAALGFDIDAIGVLPEGANNVANCGPGPSGGGCPGDDSITPFFPRKTTIPGKGIVTRIVPPAGGGGPWVNLNPSGNSEWELFRVGVTTGNPVDALNDCNPPNALSAPCPPGTNLQTGLWHYEIEGMDLGNLFANRFDKILLVEPLMIGDFVYCDGATDTGKGGVLMELLDPGNNVVKTTTTIASGFYSFAVEPGTWTVRVAASNFAAGGALEGRTSTTGGNSQTKVVTDSNVLTYDFGYDCETTIPCPISTDPTVVIIHNANGTTTVTLQQSLAVNDNSYGTGTDPTWGGQSHSFNNLLGSDKAQFVFKNGNGQVVSDFFLDYISAKPGTPSGYGSLGAAGGDGSINTGPAPVSWTTSMDDNMNIACPPPSGPWTTNSPSSPGPDPACALWEFKSIYKVTVNDSIFGPSGFGSVTIPLVHNSPDKPTQTCPVICPDVNPDPTMDILDLGTQIQVTYTQSLNANDNSYGTGTDATWGSKDHTFNNLLGSDKAQFVFKNGNGQVVSDFFLDYISAKPGTPSGYGSLGAAGGDGSINTGPPPASWTTSMDDNMNIACPPPSGPWTTNSPNSPGPDPACPGWQFKSIYKVVVNKSIFGASGFGGVTVPLVHNSPAKPPCPTAGVSQCNFAILEREIKDKQVKITIKNNGNVDEFVSAVHLTWPAATNGKLKKVKIGGDVIYDSPDIAGGTADLTTAQLTSDQNKRKIKKGEKVTVTFEFEKNASTTLANYSGSLEFGPNCMLTILP